MQLNVWFFLYPKNLQTISASISSKIQPLTNKEKTYQTSPRTPCGN